MNLRRNIPLHYSFTFLNSFVVTQALWMIYLTERGFSLIEVGLLEAIFHFTSFVSEVPTGAVADIWGRKASRITGRVFKLLSLALMFYSTSFLGQMLGFIFCAWGWNLESGAGEALLYDSLLALGRQDDFTRINSRGEFLYQAASVGAFLAGGYLAVRSYSAAFGLGAVITLLALVNALGFQEPYSEKKSDGESKRKDWRAFGEQFLVLGRLLKEKPRLIGLMAVTELLGTFMTVSYFYLQPHWKGSGLDEFAIGAVFAVSSIVSGLVGLLAPKVMNRVSLKRLISLFFLIHLGALIILGWVTTHPAVYLMFGSLESLFFVVTSDFINRRIPSEVRATTLSCQSMIFSLFMIILFPLAGAINQALGIMRMFQVLALLALIGGFIGGFAVFSKKKVLNSD